MNGKKAKRLRKKTAQLMKGVGIPLGEGYREYKQLENCISWERFDTTDGKVAVDPDGAPLLRPIKKPGTLENQWKFRAFNKFIKKLHKKHDTEGILKLEEVDGD